MRSHFLLILSVVSLTSCGIKNDYARFSSLAMTHPPKNAKPLSLHIAVEDFRESQDVGYIKNGLEMKTGRIISKAPVSQVLYAATLDSLANHGLLVTSPGPLTLLIKIQKCFSEYTTGIFITRAKASIILEVSLISQQQEELYHQVIHGEGLESPVFIYSGKNTGKALSKALKNTLDTLCQDLMPILGKDSFKEKLSLPEISHIPLS